MVEFFATSVTLMGIFLFGTIGELLTQKTGHLNLGTPGVMCLGATGGILALTIYSNACGGSANCIPFLSVLFGVIGALIVGALGGLLYSFFAVTLKANQNVVGLCLTTLGVGIFSIVKFEANMSDTLNLVTISYNAFKNIFPTNWIDSTGWFGKIFLGHGFLTYFSLVISIVVGLVIRKTNIGLSIRSIGENPGTADAAGINVDKVRYGATIIGTAISGLGGLMYCMEYCNGTPEIQLEAFGWIAVALVISSLWISELGMASSFVFAMLYVAPSAFALGGSGAEAQIFTALPYAITIILLVATSIINKRELQGPASLGLTYFREDR